MKITKQFYLLVFCTFLIASACQLLSQVSSQATPSPVKVEPTQPPTEMPVLTPTWTPEPSVTPIPSPEVLSGSVSGRLSYPSEFIPAMRIVAFSFGTDTFYTLDTVQNQPNYQLDGLPEGDYHLVAYTLGEGSFPAGLSGGYTQAVICGMLEGCSDHTLVVVKILTGQVVENVDLVDWLVPLPPMPQPGQPVQGTITGRLSYPSEMIPSMRVVAFRIDDGRTFSLDTQANQNFYTLFVPAGTYHVVAYAMMDGATPGLPGGYSQMVPCGLSVDCADHSLIDVEVIQGSVTWGVDPGDFYAPDGAFPPVP